MRIGQLAEHTGVSPQTIRYYEVLGVLPEARRSNNGYRSYDTDTADRIAFIRDAQSAGMTLVEIQAILDLRDSGESTCGHVIGSLERHLSELDLQLADLERTRQRLVSIIDNAKRLDPTECSDPNRCQTIPRGIDEH